MQMIAIDAVINHSSRDNVFSDDLSWMLEIPGPEKHINVDKTN